MALRRNVSQRLSHITKISSSAALNLTSTAHSSSSSKVPPESTKPNFFRRFLQKRALVESAMSSDTYRSSFKLMEKLKGMNNLTKDRRLRLDGLIAPSSEHNNSVSGISVDDARKLLKLAQLETLKLNLRNIRKSSISYSEFLQICKENSSGPDQGLQLAKMLDESGAVIVIKNSVFLRPEEVAKAIQGVIPLPRQQPINDPRTRELEKMEQEKLAIDKKAEALVRAELRCGLGFLLVQTVGFMRLTFWELSWDVMEPICFYVTSFYFMASYGFFLRTSQEPTFEGFFQSRFRAKQKRIIKAQKFDLEKFYELRRACYPHEAALDEQALDYSSPAPAPAPAPATGSTLKSLSNDSRGNLIWHHQP